MKNILLIALFLTLAIVGNAQVKGERVEATYELIVVGDTLKGSTQETISDTIIATKDYVDNQSISSILSTNVNMDSIGGATYYTLQHLVNSVQSSGVISGGVMTDGGSGTIDISAGTAIIKKTDSDIGDNTMFDFDALSSVALTDEATNYIYISYNSGSPQISVSTSNVANGHNTFNLGKVFKEGSSLDIVDAGLNIYDFPRRVQQHHVDRNGLEFVSGGTVAEVGTRNISITSGIMYAGLNRIITDAINTSTGDDFEYYYNNGSWVETDEIQIDNLQYNNYGTGLATLSNNQYGVHWVYKGTGSKSYVIYGTDSYTLLEANEATEPANKPAHVSGFGVLRAKIVIAKSGTVFTEVINYIDGGSGGSSGSVSAHNDATGIQGGAAGDYYHLLQSELLRLQDSTIVSDASNDVEVPNNFTVGSGLIYLSTTGTYIYVDGSGNMVLGDTFGSSTLANIIAASGGSFFNIDGAGINYQSGNMGIGKQSDTNVTLTVRGSELATGKFVNTSTVAAINQGVYTESLTGTQSYGLKTAGGTADVWASSSGLYAGEDRTTHPSTPPSGMYFYYSLNGIPYMKDDAGNEYNLTSSGTDNIYSLDGLIASSTRVVNMNGNSLNLSSDNQSSEVVISVGDDLGGTGEGGYIAVDGSGVLTVAEDYTDETQTSVELLPDNLVLESTGYDAGTVNATSITMDSLHITIETNTKDFVIEEDSIHTSAPEMYIAGKRVLVEGDSPTANWQSGSGYIAPATITDEVRIGNISDYGDYSLQVYGNTLIWDTTRIMHGLEFREISSVGTPDTGFGVAYAQSDGKLYFRNDNGSEYDLTRGAFPGTQTITYSATPTFDYDTSEDATITLASDVTTFTFSNIPDQGSGNISVIQSSIGGYGIAAITHTGLTVKYLDSQAPTAAYINSNPSGHTVVSYKRLGSYIYINYGSY